MDLYEEEWVAVNDRTCPYCSSEPGEPCARGELNRYGSWRAPYRGADRDLTIPLRYLDRPHRARVNLVRMEP